MDTPQRVALFVTCIVDQLMPEVGVATVKLLRRAGCNVVFPSQQTCCGQPFFNSGFRKEAQKLAMRSIEIFENEERVVLPSGSCTSMIRAEYPDLLADHPGWSQRAERLAAKTFELSEFLVHQAAASLYDPNVACIPFSSRKFSDVLAFQCHDSRPPFCYQDRADRSAHIILYRRVDTKNPELRSKSDTLLCATRNPSLAIGIVPSFAPCSA